MCVGGGVGGATKGRERDKVYVRGCGHARVHVTCTCLDLSLREKWNTGPATARMHTCDNIDIECDITNPYTECAQFRERHL